MEYQSLLHKKLHTGNFVFTAEPTPPDASDKDTLIKKVAQLKDIADAINVTDSPGAKVHMAALTAAIILAQNNNDPILGKLSSLIQWHYDDPVDDFEINRNEIIYE